MEQLIENLNDRHRNPSSKKLKVKKERTSRNPIAARKSSTAHAAPDPALSEVKTKKKKSKLTIQNLPQLKQSLAIQQKTTKKEKQSPTEEAPSSKSPHLKIAKSSKTGELTFATPPSSTPLPLSRLNTVAEKLDSVNVSPVKIFKSKDGSIQKVGLKKSSLAVAGKPSEIGKDKVQTQKKKKDKLKQVTLSEVFQLNCPSLNADKKNSESPSSLSTKSKKKKAAVAEAKVNETRQLDDKKSNLQFLPTASPTVKVKDKKSKSRKSKGFGKPKKLKKDSKKKMKMDVVEKTMNNHQKLDTIDISDNSTDSAELKIATNEDEDETSELSSEYDSSDSEHIMKNIKSFNKKGASKTVNKKDEPPPPKVKPKIYSSSEEGEEDSSKEEDDDDEELEEKNQIKMLVSEDCDTPLKSEFDGFFNGWSKTDVEELLKRIHNEIPKNDNIKASTRVKQLNWENIKFGPYSGEQCLEKWKTIEKKIRGYRILEELLSDAKQWLEQPWTDFYKGNKKKYQRHPEMPKKPLTSYMLFYLKKKEKISKEFPQLSLTDLSKVIAERFNKLAPTKKAKYNELALKMKEDYVNKMKKFAETHPTEMARLYNNAGRARRAQNTMPGWSGGFKPLPPVKLYVEEKIKQDATADPSLNLNERAATYKEKWKTLSNKKKLPWIRWASETEAKYLEELKAYHTENPHYEMPKYKSVLLKEEKNILEKQQGKPDKPPPSAYLLFSSQMLRNPNLRKLTPKERMQETARLWKNVPKIEKEGYAEEVKRLADRYKLEYASWLETLPEERRLEELANNAPKRKTRDSKDGPKAKRNKAASKNKSNKPRMSVEEILRKEPVPPPKDAYALFAEEYKNYPEKEIKKSWDALLEAPRAKLESRLAKLKQQYLLDFREFLKSLNPEDLKQYSKLKSSQDAKIMKLSDTEEESDELGEEEEDEEEEEEEEDDDNNADLEEEEAVAQAKCSSNESAAPLPNNSKPIASSKGRQVKGNLSAPPLSTAGNKPTIKDSAPSKADISSESEDEEDKGERQDGTASSTTSSDSSSEEEEEESTSSTNSSSSSGEDNIADAF